MNPEKFANIVSMSTDDRYWYFIRKVADFRKVWLLQFGNGSPLAIETEPGTLVYPFWPEKEFAEATARERECWEPTKPVARPLKEFMERWLPGMQRNSEKAGIFWVGPDLVGIDVEPNVLLQDLKAECGQYEG
jgi:Protein of unknown function (DUF2750)